MNLLEQRKMEWTDADYEMLPNTQDFNDYMAEERRSVEAGVKVVGGLVIGLAVLCIAVAVFYFFKFSGQIHSAILWCAAHIPHLIGGAFVFTGLALVQQALFGKGEIGERCAAAVLGLLLVPNGINILVSLFSK